MKVYWSALSHHEWILYAAATTDGLCCVTFPNQGFDTVTSFVTRYFPHATLEHDTNFLAPFIAELKEYLDGKRTRFTVPLDLRGTPFQRGVWTSLLSVPHGTTVTYSDVAESVGNSMAVRAVGTAIGRNPIAFVVPCHRVIGKDGSLTGYRGGLEVKCSLLKLEGIR